MSFGGQVRCQICGTLADGGQCILGSCIGQIFIECKCSICFYLRICHGHIAIDCHGCGFELCIAKCQIFCYCKCAICVDPVTFSVFTGHIFLYIELSICVFTICVFICVQIHRSESCHRTIDQVSIVSCCCILCTAVSNCLKCLVGNCCQLQSCRIVSFENQRRIEGHIVAQIQSVCPCHSQCNRFYTCLRVSVKHNISPGSIYPNFTVQIYIFQSESCVGSDISLIINVLCITFGCHNDIGCCIFFRKRQTDRCCLLCFCTSQICLQSDRILRILRIAVARCLIIDLRHCIRPGQTRGLLICLRTITVSSLVCQFDGVVLGAHIVNITAGLIEHTLLHITVCCIQDNLGCCCPLRQHKRNILIDSLLVVIDCLISTAPYITSQRCFFIRLILKEYFLCRQCGSCLHHFYH